MKINWKTILEYAFNILTPFIPKGWRTVILNALVFILGVSELIMSETGGLITLLCTHFQLACEQQVAGIIVTITGVLNMLLRTITDTPVTASEPKTDQ